MMTMTKKFKILADFVKDISVETADVETYLFVKDNITKYHLGIDIISKPLKNKMIEVETTFNYQDKEANAKRSLFEIKYAAIVKLDDDVKDKDMVKKILLCEVQKEIYPKLEKCFTNLIKDSGFPELKFEKKVDFDELFKQRSS